MKTSFITSLLLIASLLSCSQYKAESPDSNIAEQQPAAEPLAFANAKLTDIPDHDPYADATLKLIKTADYQFEVANVKGSTEAIEGAIRKYPSYISASNLKLEYTSLEQTLTIRVQSEYFYDLLKDIDAQALHVHHREITTNDVSKEFVDLESRLKTKREVEARYAEILRTKAGKIEELLEAEAKIGALHEEIEATISRMNYLKSQVSYSTINLEYFQKVAEQTASNEETISGKFTRAIATGWSVVVGVVIALTYLWPIMIVAGIVAIVYYLRHKKTRVA